MNEVDELCNAAPPEEAAYQSMVSTAPGVAEMVTVPVPHLDAPAPAGATGTVFTVAITAILVADIHPLVVFLD